MAGSAELYAVDDLDDLNQEVGWQAEYRQLRSGSFYAQFCFGKSSIFDLTKEFVTGPLEVMAADQDDAVSLLIRRPSLGEFRINGSNMDCGDTFLLMPGSEIRAHTQSNIVVDTVRIPLKRIADVAGAFDLEWRGFLPGPSRKLRLHHETIEGFTLALDNALFAGSGERARSEARLTEAVESFVRSVLLPIDAKNLQEQRPRFGSRGNIQNALEFIEANLAGRISVADVCRQADVEIRTLERHFARETGVLPAAYIKARRLNAARRSLLAAHPEKTRVTQVAAEHGITHLGRFAVEYRRFFGERPSQTLMRLR